MGLVFGVREPAKATPVVAIEGAGWAVLEDDLHHLSQVDAQNVQSGGWPVWKIHATQVYVRLLRASHLFASAMQDQGSQLVEGQDHARSSPMLAPDGFWRLCPNFLQAAKRASWLP